MARGGLAARSGYTGGQTGARPFTLVVRYRLSDATFDGDFITLLDAASHCNRQAHLVHSPLYHGPRCVLPSVIDRVGPTRLRVLICPAKVAQRRHERR